MAFSYREYIADGSTDSFALPFDYIAAADISVYVDGVEDTSFTFTSSSTIQTSSMPSSGVVVRVERNTELEERLVDFASGSVLTEEDLDNANIQVFYAAQEAIDAAGESVAKDLDGVLDAQNRRIKNLADPINDQDAVTKSWAEDGMTSQLNIAEGYKNTAVSSASTAIAKASEAATSASLASTLASQANTSAVNAAQDASDAAASATAAAGSATSASNSATAAATSASNASTSATNAANSATSASGSASAAANSATAAATSEDNAADSETAAATSETNAANSATAAAGSATASSNSANASATSATNSANSATASANSATASANSATAAASSASDAATSESNAANSATAAASSASSAATSASAAQAAEDAALAALDSFDDRYLGQKASAPSTDNDGDALVAGALYFNTSDSTMKVYDGSTWVAAYASASGALQETGGTMTGNLSFGDNVKAIFGAGSDLQIYHDGSNSYVRENGTGSLYIAADANIWIGNSGITEAKIKAITNGAVELYYDGGTYTTPKLSTTSTGIDVTGTVTADGLTVDGDVVIDDNDANPIVLRRNGGSDANISIEFDQSSHSTYVGADYTGNFTVGRNADLNAQKALKVFQNGDISFYEDTGTTPKFFWDASAESLGIGVSSIGTQGDLYIGGSGVSDDVLIGLSPTNSSGGQNPLSQIGASADGTYGSTLYFNTRSTGGTVAERMRIDSSGNVGIGNTNPSSHYGEANRLVVQESKNGATILGMSNPTVGASASVQLKQIGGTANSYVTSSLNDNNGNPDYNYIFGTGVNHVKWDIGGSEAMRINSSGDLLIGTTDTLPDANNVEGIALSAGTYGGRVAISRNGLPLALNRTTDNGNFIQFQVGGVSLGNIESVSGRLKYNFEPGGEEYVTSPASGVVSAESRGNVQIFTDTNNNGSAASDAFVIHDGDNYGGTTTRLLTIRKDGGFQLGSTLQDGYTKVDLLTDTFNGDAFLIAYGSTNPESGNIALKNNSTGGDIFFATVGGEAMRIDSSGNLKFNSGYGSVAPAYGCRAWVNFNGTGTPSIREDGNVSSITDHGTGQYSINFSSAMPDANYSIVGGTIGSNGNWAYNIRTNNSSISTSSARFSTGFSNADALYDIPYIHLAVFR